MKKPICYLLVTLIALMPCGCVEPPLIEGKKTFDVEPVDTCLGVMIDMSGSFHANWEDRAHKLFMKLLSDLFSASAGNECRVVLGQLSASDPVVLFEGRPRELRNRFRTPEDLNSFLQAKSDPSSSNVYQSTSEMLDYVRSINGVEEGTQLIVVCLSDMVDSQTDEAQSQKLRDELLESLKLFHENKGALAMYYVAQQHVKQWRLMLAEAGFQTGDFVIETSLSESPQLPEFH